MFAALDVFSKLRRRLDAELGIRPSPLLAQTHVRVLRQQVGAGGAAATAP